MAFISPFAYKDIIEKWYFNLRLKMKNHEPAGTIIKENLIDFIARKINQLPEAER